MASRRSGEATQCRQNRDVDENDRGPPGPLRRTLLLHKKTIGYFLFKISAAPPLHGEVSKTYKKTTRRPSYQLMAQRPTQPHTARRPTTRVLPRVAVESGVAVRRSLSSPARSSGVGVLLSPSSLSSLLFPFFSFSSPSSFSSSSPFLPLPPPLLLLFFLQLHPLPPPLQQQPATGAAWGLGSGREGR